MSYDNVLTHVTGEILVSIVEFNPRVKGMSTDILFL